MTEKMKKSEFIELWLQALESGKYKQGKNYLVTSKGQYCCLGVACVVASDNKVRNIYIKADVNQLLPQTLSNFLNMSAEGAFHYYISHNGKEFRSLVDLNDSGIKFKTIARIIREQIKAKNFVGKDD